MEESKIQSVIDRVMSELGHREPAGRAGPLPPRRAVARQPGPAATPRHGDNLFPDVESAVAAAGKAYRDLQELPVSVREQMIAHMRRTMR
ncbi:MAG: hypothetical protein KAJ13_02430, partial [Gemmatimonadetes bacterium]|nr:hypothetical protein [Gemmatimonadota bacterium]MCK5482523.1 hypothetical protein [Gemmatimonadota bacterium]